jgi:hypothetical protein
VWSPVKFDAFNVIRCKMTMSRRLTSMELGRLLYVQLLYNLSLLERMQQEVSSGWGGCLGDNPFVKFQLLI